MTARKHHYVPQCYLKLFSTQHKKVPQLVVFDRERKKTFKTGIDNVAAQRDFNAIEVEGLNQDAFEQDMSGFETALSDALQRIAAARSLSIGEDRAYLLNLVGLTALRNPRFRESIRQAHVHTARIIMEQVLQTPETYARTMADAKADGALTKEHDVTYDDLKKFVESGNYKITMNNTYQIGQELQVFDKILPLLFQRGWMLVRAPDDSAGFVTSDHPFCIMWSDPKMRGGLYGPGLGLPGTDIFFTVSPRLGVIGSYELKDSERDITEHGVAGINGAMIASAQNQVYARDYNFMYSMQPGEVRKASRLIGDKRFLRPAEKVGDEA